MRSETPGSAAGLPTGPTGTWWVRGTQGLRCHDLGEDATGLMVVLGRVTGGMGLGTVDFAWVRFRSRTRRHNSP